MSFCAGLNGARIWRYKAFAEPRPIYGLDRLARFAPDVASAIVVEGEGKADALWHALGETMPVLGWPGGCKVPHLVDWSPLAGRRVVCWPDADAAIDKATQALLPAHKQPGMQAMLTIRRLLGTLGCAVGIVDIGQPGERPAGWDCGDAVREGMDREALLALMARVLPGPESDAAPAKGAALPAPGATGSPNLRLITGAAAPAPSAQPAGDDSDRPSHPGAGAGRKDKPIDFDRLNWLSDNIALIYSTDTVWDAASRLIMRIAALAHAKGSDYVKMWKSRPESAVRGAGTRWTVQPDKVVFDPTCKADPDTHVNLFGGIVLEPKQGNVEPMLQLVRHLTSRASESADDSDQVMHWLLCWLAYPLQRLGAKLRTAVIMHGDEGAGKNFLFDTQVLIYSEYGAIVGQDELEDKFNDWRSRKLFVMGDEVSSRQELVHNKNRLKALITSPTVQINPKGLPRREEANHMNITFLSNELQPQALDNTDRRYLVIYTPPALEFDFYRRLGQWRDKQGGLQAWYHYLLHYPVEGFDPYAPAPVTQAKLDLIDLNRKTPERFWLEWEAGEIDLPYRSCTVDQAYQAYLRYCQRCGDRYPAQKAMFSRMVVRLADSRGRPVRIKTMKTDDRSRRMWLVTDPPETGQGQWATETQTAFARALRDYLSPHSPHGADQEGA